MERSLYADEYDRCMSLFAVMREWGIQVRYNGETHALVWKPKPKKWNPLTLAELHERELDVVRLLVPGKLYERRAGWTLSSLAACVGCGSSTALLDPLNQPRHNQCGFLGQTKAYRATQHSASQAKMRQQG